jgi:hypothetical protein
MIINLRIILGMRNVLDKICSENQNTYSTLNKFYLKIVPFVRQRGKNMVEPDRPQMAIRHMSFACWITNVTNTPSEYVTLLAFPMQQWLHERASMLRYRYTSCLVCNYKCRTGRQQESQRCLCHNPADHHHNFTKMGISSHTNICLFQFYT